VHILGLRLPHPAGVAVGDDDVAVVFSEEAASGLERLRRARGDVGECLMGCRAERARWRSPGFMVLCAACPLLDVVEDGHVVATQAVHVAGRESDDELGGALHR
jgi:hypothetical protein